jgi:superfamily II DNA or RNA helicase
MPTGAGKTVAFVALIGRLGSSALVLVHRDELVRQAVATIAKMYPDIVVGVVQAERNEWDKTPDGRRPAVVVASVQSLHEKRLRQIPRDRFKLLITDEAHHVAARTWAAVLDHFQTAFVLGVTATPERADGQGLADRFGREPLYHYPLRQAIEDGYLARLTQYAVETRADLNGVRRRGGDFVDSALARVVNTGARNRVVVEAYERYGEPRRAIAFCVDVAHGEALAAAFEDAGIAAAAVTGTMPRGERRAVLAAFERGQIQVLTNCAVLTEGYDSPGIECILMARPTSSRPLYTQCIGRGLRTAPGKADCLVLDFVDNAKKHKLVTALDLMGAPRARDAGGRDVIRVAGEDQQRVEEEATIEALSPLAWRASEVCPWPVVPDLVGYVPRFGWQAHPASAKQLRFIRLFGVSVSRSLTKGEAAYLIAQLRKCDATHPTPATSRQRYFLRCEGLWEDGMTKWEAQRLIARVKSSRFVGAA